MTNIFKNTLLKYISGNISDTQSNNTPTLYEDSGQNMIDTYLKENLQNGNKYDLSYEIKSTISIEDYTICAGIYNDTSIDIYKTLGFLLLLDKDFTIVKLFKKYSSGTKMSAFELIEIDEKGCIYGVDTVSNRYRFIMLNNPTLKVNNEYQVTLRQTYYLPDSYQQNSSNSKRIWEILRKNPNNSEYYLFGEMTGSDYTYVTPFYLHLKVNVGTTNEWEENQIEMHTFGMYITDAIITYGYTEGKDLVVICGYSDSFLTRKYVQYSYVGVDEVSQGFTYDFNNCFYLKANMISENETYIAVTEAKASSGTDRFRHRLKIYHRTNENYNKIYDSNSYSDMPRINLFKKNNCVYCLYQVGLSHDGYITYVEPNFIACFDNYTVECSFGMMRVTYTDAIILQVLQYNNLVIAYIQYMNTYLKVLFYKSSENTYKNIDCLKPDYANIQNNSNILYSKDIEGITQNKKVCIATLNMTNVDINDKDFNYQTLYSKTNMEMLKNNSIISKNIYENLYLNFIYTFCFKNQNEIESNMIDNSELLMTSTLNGGYDNFHIYKLELVYEDNTTSDIILTSEVNLYSVTLSCILNPQKNVKLIRITNKDKSIIFLTIPVNLLAGKTYDFSQDIEVE